MPTEVHFIGLGGSLRLSDDYRQVTKGLNGREAGEFTLEASDSAVTVYKSAVAFVTEAQPREVLPA